MRPIIRKVIFEPSADGNRRTFRSTATAAILAVQEAWQEAFRELREQHSAEFVRKRATGEFKSVQEKVKYLNRCQAILAEKEAEWMRLPVLFGCGGRI
ncbi:MAG TPA: hypothetical protein VGO22_03945 [Pseudorhizobium sp.]|nr:hypothetical protein [Pseudorhizobium sp.]